MNALYFSSDASCGVRSSNASCGVLLYSNHHIVFRYYFFETSFSIPTLLEPDAKIIGTISGQETPTVIAPISHLARGVVPGRILGCFVQKTDYLLSFLFVLVVILRW